MDIKTPFVCLAESAIAFRFGHNRNDGGICHNSITGEIDTVSLRQPEDTGVVDAYHMTAPRPDGSGGADAMALALADGGVRPEEVDYINAHGTSTHLNDAGETAAIKTVFGDHAYRLAVSSTKSMTGHMLGAAGAVEAIFTALALRDGYIPATIHYQIPDPACDLDVVPNQGREADIRCALSNSLGFGGHNGCLLFKKWEA